MPLRYDKVCVIGQIGQEIKSKQGLASWDIHTEIISAIACGNSASHGYSLQSHARNGKQGGCPGS